MTDTLRAIALMTLAMAAFAVADMSIKLLSDTLPVSQIMMTIGVGGALLFGLLVKSRGLPLMTPLWRHPGVLARNAAEIIGSIGIVTAITLIPYSQTTSVMQAVPLCVTLGAAVLFGAPVGVHRWTAILVGLVGVLIIVAPEPGDGITPGILLALAGMLGMSCRDLATRYVPASASTLELGYLSMLATIVAALILLPLDTGTWVVPGPVKLAQVAMLIAAVGVAYFGVTGAMRIGDIGAVAPFRYTRIFFAFVLSVTVLGETLTARTLLGAALVVLAGLYTLMRERKRARTLQTAVPTR